MLSSRQPTERTAGGWKCPGITTERDQKVLAMDEPITIGDDPHPTTGTADDVPSELSELLVAKRRERGDSQADLARHINAWMIEHGHDIDLPQMSTSQAAISKIEAGLTHPIPAKIPAFADYLEMTVGEVVRASTPQSLGSDVAVLREQVAHERSMRAAAEMRAQEYQGEMRVLQSEIQRLVGRVRRLERKQTAVSGVASTSRRPTNGRNTARSTN